MAGAGAAAATSVSAAGFADIFDEMFGEFMGGRRGGRASGRARGADLRYNLEIGLEDAFGGKQTSIRVPTPCPANPAHGTGAEKGTQPEHLQTCRGHGKVRASQGFFTIERTCPTCQRQRPGDREALQGLQRLAAACGRKRRSRSISRPASRTARASVWPAKARPA